LQAIETEINSTQQENTIFRGNSLASKMFKTYSRLFGLPYIFHTLALIIRQLEANDENEQREKKETDHDIIEFEILDINMELDDTKVSKDEIEENVIFLKIISEKIFAQIIQSKKDLPGQFIEIFSTVRNGIENKFPGQNQTLYNAVGGMFFLRFVIPSIFAPHYYGLMKQPPTQTNQRQLVLLSKVIQSIANMVLPGQKEQFMESMHSYIQKKLPTIKAFYDDITRPIAQPRSDIIPIPKSIKKNAMSSLWNLFRARAKQTLEALEQSPNTAAEVEELLRMYPEPEKLD